MTMFTLMHYEKLISQPNYMNNVKGQMETGMEGVQNISMGGQCLVDKL